MTGNIKRFLRRLPFVFKALFLTLFVGLFLGLITDHYVGRIATNVFLSHLQNMLAQQSQENRLRFDHYLKNFYNVAKLTALHAPFLAYLEDNNWDGQNADGVSMKDRLPDWFLSSSVLSNLAVPRFVLLLDGQGRVKEAYSRNQQEALPGILMNPPPLILERSREQAYIYEGEQGPIALTAQDIEENGVTKATLLLASPIDEQFLVATQKDMPQRLVGLVNVENNTLVASNNERILPAGIALDRLQENFVVIGREYNDYGGSEMAIRLSSFVSNRQVKELSIKFVASERRQRAVSAAVYLFMFVLIILWITKRIDKLTNKIETFSALALGGQNPQLPPGDKFDILAERFQILTQEILASHRQIEEREREQAAQRLEVESKSRQLDQLESVMDSLGVGVLIRHGDKLAPLNNKMISYLELVDDPMVFDVEEGLCREQACMYRDGRRMFYQLTGYSLFGGEKAILVKDITDEKTVQEERRKLQEELIQAQKMESVGRLAGGIAHDFNNILTAILGYAQLGIFKAKDDDRLRANFQTIFESGKRAADMTQQLLAFSRKQMIEPKPVSLNLVVENLQKMLGRLIGENILVEVALEERLHDIEADRTQMEQLLMNLALNARDAMPQGGKLLIETGNVEVDPALSRELGDLEQGSYVRLAVTDTGVGISKKELEHIFEPFYTTKDIGKGTGLGLATVYGIVKQSKGGVLVHSEESRGTVFELYFPAIKHRRQSSDLSKKRKKLASGTETILLVEDDMNVRKLVGSVLDGSGYRVLEAGDGKEAENLAAKNNKKIDLLLTDVVMPGINGRELAVRLVEVIPSLKVLYMTGYTDDSKVIQELAEQEINLLHKPLTPMAITEKVREVLDQ